MEKTTVWVYSVLNHVTLRLVETEDNLEQQKQQQTDRRAAMLDAFDNMSEESQIDMLAMARAVALASPRRASVVLRLVADNASLSLRKSSGGNQ